MVEYVSEVITESGGVYPFGNGSSSSDGKKCSDDEWYEERSDLRFEFAVKPPCDVLKEFEGALLSFLKHGSPFWANGCLLQTILYTERLLPVKTNFLEKFLERAKTTEQWI
jgi:hypothetical protein